MHTKEMLRSDVSERQEHLRTHMPKDLYTKTLLTTIALSLAVIACRPLISPRPILAGASSPDLYIEPGVFPLRAADASRSQVGKVVVDLRTGNVWGFPTSPDSPAPFSLLGGSGVTVSKPFLLGKFDLNAINSDNGQ